MTRFGSTSAGGLGSEMRVKSCCCQPLLFVLAFVQLQAQSAAPSESKPTVASEESREGGEVSDSSSPNPPSPISSRAKQWSQRRLQKSQKKGAVRASVWQKMLLQLEKRGFQSLVSYKDFYGRFGSITSGSGFAPGARYWKPNINNSLFTVQAWCVFFQGVSRVYLSIRQGPHPSG